MKLKIFILMFCMILLVGNVSASSWDNWKYYDKDTKTITIKNNFILKDLGKATLNFNSYDCGRYCSSEKDITLYEDGPLIEDSRFWRLFSNGTKTLENPISHNFRYLATVPSYEWDCSEIHELKNGTKIYDCEEVQRGTHKEWKPYKVGEEVKAGTYKVELKGEKRTTRVYDWEIMLHGKWLNEWAIWGNISLGDAAEIILNSPADLNITDFTNVTFNATANVTGGATLINMSLYLNSSGTWAINETVTMGTLASNTSTHGQDLTNSASDQQANGIEIFVKQNITLKEIELFSGSTPSTISIWSNATFVAENSSVVSGNATFNVALIENTLYQIFSSNNAVAYTQKWNNSAIFPYSTTQIDFIVSRRNTTGFPYTINSADILQVKTIRFEEDSSVTTSTEIFNKIINGSTIWNVQGCDSDGVCGFAPANFTVSLDSTAPHLNITSPNETFDFQAINTNLSLNWNITDDLSLGSCWFNWNGTNETVTCSDNQTNINITDGTNKNLTFYVNDTSGNLNNSFVSWDYKVFENNQTFNEAVFEGNLETFTANIIIEDSNSVSVATLFYNETQNVGTFSVEGVNTIISSEIQIPQVNIDTNVSFIWNVLLSGGESINITQHNQTITSISLDDCSVNTVVVYNYTIVDEGNQSFLTNTTAEINVNLMDSSRQNFIANFSTLFLNVNPFSVCLNTDFESAIYSIDSIVKYEAEDHVVEYYNLLNTTLTNQTIPMNITLYDLNETDSTEFKISFKGEDFVFVENALIFIDRQYLSENNTFKTVELPKTDSEGQTVGHFVRSDAVYNIRVIKEGEVLGNFENIIAFCQDFTIGDCQIVLVATPTTQSTFDYDSELGIIFQTVPTFDNDTNSVSFSYSTDDGSSKTVLLEVTRNDVFGNRTICNNTVSSSSGTLSCSVDPSIDETNLVTKVFVEGKLTVLGNIVLDNSSIYGNLGYTLWFFLTFIFILGFGTSKTEVLIGLAVSVIGAISLGLVRGDLVGIGSAGIWMLVIVVLGIWKLNKENSQ